MIDLIVKSVTKNLRAKFTTIPVINEDLPQNLPEPCFYIAVLSASKKELLNDRYILNVPLDIHYFPSNTKNKKSEMNTVSMELLHSFRFLDLYEPVNNVLTKVGMLKGFNFHTEIVDNVLHFFVEYKPTIRNKAVVDDNLMNSLTRVVEVDD